MACRQWHYIRLAQHNRSRLKNIISSFVLLVYFDNNNDGIKENLHHTNFNNQKIICQYTDTHKADIKFFFNKWLRMASTQGEDGSLQSEKI